MSDPILSSMISRDSIMLDEQFDDKHEAIESLLNLVDQTGAVKNREKALEALEQREKEATTGVGKGIGIPHAKTEAVKRPSVAFIRAEEGVDFGASDGAPAKLLFMLLFPDDSDDEYLELLSRISRALIHEEVRESLLEAEGPDRVMQIIEEEISK